MLVLQQAYQIGAPFFPFICHLSPSSAIPLLFSLVTNTHQPSPRLPFSPPSSSPLQSSFWLLPHDRPKTCSPAATNSKILRLDSATHAMEKQSRDPCSMLICLPFSTQPFVSKFFKAISGLTWYPVLHPQRKYNIYSYWNTYANRPGQNDVI